LTFKGFFIRLYTLTFTVIFFVIGYNFITDDYGLFRETSSLDKKIYFFDGTSERTGKYLLSYKYIPENFDGVLIGPSHSANINTKDLSNTKLYNASISGGNITELKLLVEKMLENENLKLKYAVISLSDYLTKDSGKKTSSIDPREYWGSLGSISQLKHMTAKILTELGIKNERFNSYGYNKFNTSKQSDFKEVKQNRIENFAEDDIYIDPMAFKQLRETITLLRERNIKIFAYFYPQNYSLYVLNYDNYRVYEDKISSLFNEEDVVWNFNDEKYSNLTKDPNLFFDGSHLSEKSAEFVVKDIEEKISKVFHRRNSK
jgi:hypothetical protein